MILESKIRVLYGNLTRRLTGRTISTDFTARIRPGASITLSGAYPRDRPAIKLTRALTDQGQNISEHIQTCSKLKDKALFQSTALSIPTTHALRKPSFTTTTHEPTLPVAVDDAQPTIPSSSDDSTTGSPSPVEPMEEFFTSFSSQFQYKPDEPAAAQMARLRKALKRIHKNKEEGEIKAILKAAQDHYKTALVRQFNKSYGTNVDDLALDAWYKLLQRCGITPLPGTAKACKKILKRKYINLVDLHDARDDPDRQVIHFKTEHQLSCYTKEEEKYFPRDHPEASSLIKFLYRDIRFPGRRPFRVRDTTIKDKTARGGRRGK
ncbi:hypothetical protein NP233_g1918 [Leucocoprinus birnbaumii]|uniref:Uncharacterized protein n=1 Tax=Leucocoprinus birnbaumii TaxID=56174 RepID=A0AAD5W1R0_9AGAR|nr:hypothetical protein NP233_g1918 [Leucocoprinus birnbaumii]